MKGKLKTCEICGGKIDPTACNEDRGILTVKTDSDEEGTKNIRYDICGGCIHGLVAKIQVMALDYRR